MYPYERCPWAVGGRSDKAFLGTTSPGGVDGQRGSRVGGRGAGLDVSRRSHASGSLTASSSNLGQGQTSPTNPASPPDGSCTAPRHRFGFGGSIRRVAAELRDLLLGRWARMSFVTYSCGPCQCTSHMPRRCSRGEPLWAWSRAAATTILHADADDEGGQGGRQSMHRSSPLAVRFVRAMRSARCMSHNSSSFR